MKNKKKKEISNSSNSDGNENSHPSAQIVNPNSEHKSHKYLNSSSYLLQKSNVSNVSKSIESKELDLTHIIVEKYSENESSHEELSNEAASIELNKTPSKEKSYSVNSIFNIEELTSDDEIYTFQCPENYPKQELFYSNIDLGKNEQLIACNEEVYKVELLNSKKKCIILAVPGKTLNNSLVKLPFKGHILIQKEVNMVSRKSKDGEVSNVHEVVFPNDIKVRHPLLGVEWKAYIDLATKAISKNNSVRRKKNKLKKEKNFVSLEVTNRKLKRENSSADIVLSKKKKKHDL